MKELAREGLPERIGSVEELEDLLSRPTDQVRQALARVPGDLMVLGAAGKMGPTLAIMARRAMEGTFRRVIAVSRFSEDRVRDKLEDAGVETVQADLLDRRAVEALADCPNVIFMAGRKFGSTGGEALTWAMNTYVPALVAERFARSRVVVFSTGNVYPLTPVGRMGAAEDQPPAPLGEYAQSCLGRERIFEHFSHQFGTRACLLRVSYAVEPRYGVVLDVVQKVYHDEPVDVTMGHACVIWQGDANAQALMALEHCQSPPHILNVTGPEVLSIRKLAETAARLLGKTPMISGEEASTALLIDSTRACGLFGYPVVALERIVRWTVDWVVSGGSTHGKPTHFETRDGRF